MALLSIQDMHLLVMQGLQKHGVFAYRDIGSEEVDLQLNYVMFTFVKDIVRANFNRYDGLDKNLYNMNALSNIYIRKYDLGTLTSFDSGKKATIPGNILYYLPVKVTCDITYQCYDSTLDQVVTKTLLSKARILDHEDINNLTRNTFFHPTKEELVATLDTNDVYVYTGADYAPATDFIVTKIYLDFVSEPVKMLYNKDINGDYQISGSVDCPLDDSVHYDIVERTILRIKTLTETNPAYIQALDKVYKEVN